jgi:carbon monoxide dehydrogenase subunit G
VLLEASREVAASRDRLWAVVTDLEAAPTRLSGVRRVERLDGGDGFGVGTRWRETRTMFGKQATEEMEVTAVDPPSSYTLVATHGSTTYTSAISIEERGPGRCELRMTFGAVTTGTVGRVLATTFGRAAAGATRKALRRDLDDIAAAAEAAA